MGKRQSDYPAILGIGFPEKYLFDPHKAQEQKDSDNRDYRYPPTIAQRLIPILRAFASEEIFKVESARIQFI